MSVKLGGYRRNISVHYYYDKQAAIMCDDWEASLTCYAHVCIRANYLKSKKKDTGVRLRLPFFYLFFKILFLPWKSKRPGFLGVFKLGNRDSPGQLAGMCML